MSSGLARNWWVIGLRGLGAILFGFGILALPRPVVASFALMFAAYIAADGILAILSGLRAARRPERWRILVVEGATNLAVAGVVLSWPEIAILAFFRVASFWAIVSGALLLAAARRLSSSHGRWILVLAGSVSIAWAALEAAAGPSSAGDAELMGWWLAAYAIPFGAALLALSSRLESRNRTAAA
jgi:uncharacterized membrane protein HdeD (DUF308 family)